MSHDYSEVQEEKSPDQIALLGRLAGQLSAAHARVADAERVLAEAQAELKKLREQDLPELMHALGLKDITTSDGLHVTMREEVRAALPKDPVRRKAAFAWLEANGHIGLVKHELSMKFTREQRELAMRVQQELLAKFGDDVTVQAKDDIHHQTLCAFLREQLRQGEMDADTLPVFGAFIQKFAELKS